MQGALYYYKREDARLEQDFFIRSAGELVPVEIKANSNQAKSLRQLIRSDHYPDIAHGIKFTTGNIGAKGSCVIPLDLESNVVWLHKFLFNLDSYTVSDTVKECSAKVKSDTSAYVNR